MIGVKKTAVILKKATRLYKAYKDENILAAEDVISAVGPIPVRIIQAM